MGERIEAHSERGPGARTSLSREEFTHRALTVIALLMLAVLLAAIVALAADVLLVLFGGILLGVLLRGTADLLRDHLSLSPRLALTLAITVFFSILAAAVGLLGIQIAEQLGELNSSVVEMWSQLEASLRRSNWGQQLLRLLSLSEPTSNAEIATRLTQGFSTTLGALANFLVILFVGVYLAVNPQWYRRGALRLVRPDHRARVGALLDAIAHSLRWWLLGRIVGMSTVGVLTAAGLYLLDIPLVLSLGVIAAMFDFVPFIGPALAALPGVMVAMSEGPMQAAYVALLYAAIQLLEGYVITPLIEQRSVDLPPALTIAAQVLLGVLIGAPGVVFATPLTVVLVVTIKRLYVEETLEQAPSQSPGLASSLTSRSV